MIKKSLYLGLFLLCTSMQSQSLKFTYDSSGNQIRREIVNIQINSLSKGISSESDEQYDNLPESLTGIMSPNIEIYPNPVVDLLQVEWPNELNITKILLLDNNGRILQLKNISPDVITLTFDMSSYSSGLYYLRVLDVKNESKSFKIIKK